MAPGALPGRVVIIHSAELRRAIRAETLQNVQILQERSLQQSFRRLLSPDD